MYNYKRDSSSRSVINYFDVDLATFSKRLRDASSADFTYILLRVKKQL